MLRKDKTASSIKRKVQAAKQGVDKGVVQADIVAKYSIQATIEAEALVTSLTHELDQAEDDSAQAGTDETYALKFARIVSQKQTAVYKLISTFEADLDTLLEG